MNAPRRPRLLVLQVTDERSRPPEIPGAATIPDFEVEVLAISDRDETFALEATSWPVTRLRTPGPQGYGGRLKIGFHFAIERGFDAVMTLPDGARGPQLAALTAPIVEDRADTVLAAGGSQRPSLMARLQGRLVRSSVAGSNLQWRVCTTRALGRIPFHFNSDDDLFDAELTIQLLLAGQRFAEVPVSGETDRTDVDPIRSWRRLMVCLRARAQELSLFYDRKFDCRPSTVSNLHYKPRLGFESTHTLALDAIPPGSRVLDIGCAGGYFSRLLRERGCQATGVDRLPLDEGNVLDAFFLHDLNRMPLPIDVAAFDCAVMLDVLEHLQSPETFVDEFRAAAARNPDLRLIISTPNVAFIVMRLMLLAGQFNYGKRGILDLTHTRLFTFGTFRRLFEQSGYEVLEMKGVPAPYPLALGNAWTSRALLRLHKVFIALSRSLFAFQIFAIVRPKPGLAYLVETAERNALRGPVAR